MTLALGFKSYIQSAARLSAIGFLMTAPIGASGAVVKPSASAKLPTAWSVVLADTVVTYRYDLNGNRTSEAGYVQPPSVATGTVIGSGVNFLDAGGVDTFIRSPSGQIGVWETNPAGMAVGAVWLINNNGTPATVDSATTVIGTAVNFLGDGNRDLFLRLASGQILVVDETAGGVGVANQFLTNGDGTPATVDRATMVIGTAVNFLGDGNRDLFLRLASGQILVVDETAGGVGVANRFLTDGDGMPLTVDDATIVIGTGTDADTGKKDIAVQSETGQIRTIDIGA